MSALTNYNSQLCTILHFLVSCVWALQFFLWGEVRCDNKLPVRSSPWETLQVRGDTGTFSRFHSAINCTEVVTAHTHASLRRVKVWPARQEKIKIFST